MFDAIRSLWYPCEWNIVLFFNFLFYIGVELVYNAVLVSGVQQNDSVIYTYPFFLQILFPYRLLEYWVEFPVLYIKSLLIIYFIYSNVLYIYQCIYVKPKLQWQIAFRFICLKNWYKWTYLQNRNRLTDFRNKYMIVEGEGWGRGIH